jgi:large subunit ribosomal protein L18
MKSKLKTRLKRKMRTKGKIVGTMSRPRLCVFRSHKAIFAQVIDDTAQKTLIGVSERVLETKEKNKIVRAGALGEHIAGLAKTQKISTIVFDRSGYTYHGRVKALAEGLRKGGLIF